MPGDPRLTEELREWRDDSAWRPLVKVSPDPREGYMSVILRVGEANLIDDGEALMYLLSIDDVFEKSERLRWKLRMSEQEFSSFTLDRINGPSRLCYKRRAFWGAPFCVDRPRCCPHCIASAGILPAHWDINLTTACEIHGCYLIDRCPRCSRNLALKNRKAIAMCHCGQDLRDLKTYAANPANLKISSLVAYAFGTSLNAPKFDVERHFQPFNDEIVFDDLLWSMQNLISGLMYCKQSVHETSEYVSRALKFFEPMLVVPESSRLTWHPAWI